jgi:electron transfer flavoprotein beta subunit
MAAALESDEQEVRVRRDSDHSIDTLKSAWPCIISVTDQTGEPRYPSFKGIAAAKKKPVDVWSLDDLGLDGAVADQDSSYTVVDGIEERPGRGKGQVVRDESGSGAAALLDYFLQHNLLGGKSNV